MGKFLMGVFFVLIAIMLVLSLRTGTMPEIEEVGKKINEDIKEIYKGP